MRLVSAPGTAPGTRARLSVTARLAGLCLVASAVAATADDCPAVSDETQASLDLTLRPAAQNGEVTAIEVHSVIRGGLQPDSGPLSLAAPVVYAGVDGIAGRVQGLVVRDCTGRVPLAAEDDDPAPGGFPYFRHWRAQRAVTFPVTFTYSSKVRPPDQGRGPPFDIRAAAGGVTGAGSGFLVLPENAAADVSRVAWDLGALADGSRAVTTFGAGDFELQGPPQRLMQGWYMAGPFARYPAVGHVNGFSAAWLGEFPFDEHAEMEWAARAYGFLGRFFHYLDPPPRYRVFMRRVAGESGGGTALANSFMLSRGEASGEAGGSGPRDTFMHEMIHQWVGGVEAPHGVSSWFSEGLTTYYTTVLPLAAGFETQTQYGDAINTLARSYYTNPGRAMSAEQIAEVGFGDDRIRHVPYQRGALYFAHLDASIRARSGGEHGLDAFMRDVFRKRRDPQFRFDHEAWVGLVTEAAGPEAAALFRESVLGGALLVPASDAFGPCFERRPATYSTDGGKDVKGYRWARAAGDCSLPDRVAADGAADGNAGPRAARVGGEGARDAADGPPGASRFAGRSFQSRHTGVFNGVEVNYTATFADVVLRDDDGRSTASIFATAYVADEPRTADRPVIFFWNGGPSASSQTLHMAGFGPRRLVIPEDVAAPIEPPYRTRPNDHTLLDVADLVFVDPVETGFSRILEAGNRARLYSVEGDAEAVARFIRQWLRDYGREDSPRYVVGTSYGSIRAAMAARMLSETDTPLNGAILFSQGVNLVETTQRQNNLMGYVSNFSQQAAIAWYHGRTALQDRPVADVLEAADNFAMSDYLLALARGNRLPGTEYRAMAERLEALTGIGNGYYQDNGLTIKKSAFRRELLADEGLVLGMTDARYTAAAESEQRPAEPTRGVGVVQQRHMQKFLVVDLPWDEYRGMAPDSFAEWDWGGSSTMDGSKVPAGARRTVFADFDYPAALARAFDGSGEFRLMLATGIYDTQTTVGPARLLASDVRFPKDRVVVHEYPAGHSFYASDAVFERLADDVRRFLSGGR